MNIVILSHRVPYPPNKGEKIRTFHQLKRLCELGHQVHLFSPYEAKAELAFFQALDEQLCSSVHAQYINKKPVRLISGILKNQPLSVANFYNTTLQQRLDTFLTEQNVDVILCSASSMAEYVINSDVLKGLAKPPLLLMDFMDVDSDKWAQYAQNSNIPMRWVYAREQNLLAKYEKQIAELFNASFLIAQAEVSLFNQTVFETDKVHVMGNGLDTDSFYPPEMKAPNDAPIFLFTGVMDYKPNVDAVVWFVEHCWAAITAHSPNARFIIAGMNPNNDVNKLTGVSGVEVTGFVDDILPYYHQADIFVAPFRLARGVQNKVLQAFSCGLPVISTPMGAEGILCEADKDLLLANDPQSFIQQALRLIEDRSLATKLGKNAAHLIAAHYSWDSQLEPLVAMLEQEQPAP